RWWRSCAARASGASSSSPSTPSSSSTWSGAPARRRERRRPVLRSRAMISVENRVGRLGEAVLRAPITDEELGEFRDGRARVVTAIAGQRAVCVDMTGAGLLSPEQAERLIDILKQRHGGPSRVAYLLPPRAVVTLQVERILREAQSHQRRTFA